MFANSKRPLSMAQSNCLAILMLMAILPHAIVHSQTPSPAQPTKNLEANEQEKKDWQDRLTRFNGLVKEADWTKAEQLANETASKYGHQDSLVQNMLLTSINGKRKSQGLAPILIDKSYPAPDNETVAFLKVYPLKDSILTDDVEREKYVKILIECLTATMPESKADRPARIAYSPENQAIVVYGVRRQQELVESISNRLKEPSTK